MNLKENVGSRLTQAKSRLLSMNLSQWSILFLTGLLLFLLALPTTDKKTEEKQKTILSEEALFFAEESSLEDMKKEGKTELEVRLERVLSKVCGVGNVDTFVMTDEKSTGTFSAAPAQVTGVLVVAEGADNPVIVQNIKDACESLFQLEAHKIKIMKMK